MAKTSTLNQHCITEKDWLLDALMVTLVEFAPLVILLYWSKNISYPHQRHIYYTIMVSFSDSNASVAQLDVVKSYWLFKFIAS